MVKNRVESQYKYEPAEKKDNLDRTTVIERTAEVIKDDYFGSGILLTGLQCIFAGYVFVNKDISKIYKNPQFSMASGVLGILGILNCFLMSAYIHYKERKRTGLPPQWVQWQESFANEMFVATVSLIVFIVFGFMAIWRVYGLLNTIWMMVAFTSAILSFTSAIF